MNTQPNRNGCSINIYVQLLPEKMTRQRRFSVVSKTNCGVFRSRDFINKLMRYGNNYETN